MDKLSQADFTILALPSREDDLETTISKVRALSEVVEKGQSLALRTGQHVSEHAAEHRDAESIARSQMSIKERVSYDAWKAGHHLIPEINWTEHVAVVGTGARSRKRFAQRAWAMDVVWGGREQEQDEEGKRKRKEGAEGDDGHARDSSRVKATPENALWLTLNMPVMLPLLKAVVRVSNAEKQARLDPYYAGLLSEMDVVEIKTVRKTIAAIDDNVARAKAEIRNYAQSFNRCYGIIMARAQQLEGKLGLQAPAVAGKKRKHDDEY